MSLTGYSPFGRSMNRAFDQMFGDDFFRGGACPYWARIPHERSLDLGSALGEGPEHPEKFAVSVDVSHFKPDEIQVNLNGNELTVEGRREKTTRRRLMSAELSRDPSSESSSFPRTPIWILSVLLSPTRAISPSKPPRRLRISPSQEPFTSPEDEWVWYRVVHSSTPIHLYTHYEKLPTSIV
ncbi:hypothetical protein PMAYCL1PPCAC_18714 [Pristionchus mayeri]|uniref:SHSP domain-containing protein n=1 Tax=Pristionchus mayeri TaxID=1317129 RepID=A0AAN5CQE3_9BILA|nr:hypothetical protein PMAYCL1PPCAC_18714 [Pristionchus mayeri]